MHWLLPDARVVNDLLPILALFVIVFAVWAWSRAMRAREVATTICAEVCAGHELQFLDGSVSLVAIRLARSTDGRLALRRVYQFEFSRGGYNRERGRIWLVGSRVDRLEFEHPLPGLT